MSFLYATADKLGTPTGGGQVTFNEYQALLQLGEVVTYSDLAYSDPFQADNELVRHLNVLPEHFTLAHFYAGTFSKSIKLLKSRGTKVSYTAAAHNIQVSQEEHLKLGLPYPYPHMTTPALWEQYAQGYLDADLLIVPSTHSAEVMRKYGRTGPIEILPHGCSLPDQAAPSPTAFTVGYLGAVGPDKGLVYLLEAWKRLDYQDGSRLVLAGAYSITPYIRNLITNVYGGKDEVTYGGGCFGEVDPHYTTKDGAAKIYTAGWMDSVSYFYNNISLYVQPSCTEGFGIEVLEATAHSRPVLCSTGAGACDMVPGSWRFPPKDAESLANKIDLAKDIITSMSIDNLLEWQTDWRNSAKDYTWDKIKDRYVKAWKDLLK